MASFMRVVLGTVGNGFGCILGGGDGVEGEGRQV